MGIIWIRFNMKVGDKNLYCVPNREFIEVRGLCEIVNISDKEIELTTSTCNGAVYTMEEYARKVHNLTASPDRVFLTYEEACAKARELSQKNLSNYIQKRLKEFQSKLCKET